MYRSGLIDKERRAISHKRINQKDCVAENQLFEPSSSSLRKVIKNVKLGVGRPYSDDEDDFEPLYNPNNAYHESAFISARNRMTPNRRKIIDRIHSKTFCVGYIANGTGIFTASQGKEFG